MNLQTASSTDLKRHRIANEAAELFEEHGYHPTSMEDIAVAVGVSKPTLYHYFDGKDEILALIHQEFIDLLLQRQEERGQLGVPPSASVFEIMSDVLELMETHPGHVRVFFENHRELSVKRSKEIRAQRDRYQGMLESALQNGTANGDFRAVDTRLVSLALFGMVNWAYQWYQPGGSRRPREIAYVFWDLALNGLQNRTDESG